MLSAKVRQWIFVVVSALLSLTLLTAAMAEEVEKWSFSAAMDVNGKYVWRGINLTDGLVFQPSISASLKGFSISVWGNLEATDANDQSGNFTEVDYTAAYSWETKGLTLGAGLVHYTFPNIGAPATTEIYGSAAFSAPLSPTISLYYDIDEAEGFYASLGLSHTIENALMISESKSLPLELSLSLGYGDSSWNGYNHGVAKSALTDLLVSLKIPYKLSEKWTMTPSIYYTSILSGDIRDNRNSLGLGNNNNLWLGLSFSGSF